MCSAVLQKKISRAERNDRTGIQFVLGKDFIILAKRRFSVLGMHWNSSISWPGYEVFSTSMWNWWRAWNPGSLPRSNLAAWIPIQPWTCWSGRPPSRRWNSFCRVTLRCLTFIWGAGYWKFLLHTSRVQRRFYPRELLIHFPFFTSWFPFLLLQISSEFVRLLQYVLETNLDSSFLNVSSRCAFVLCRTNSRLSGIIAAKMAKKYGNGKDVNRCDLSTKERAEGDKAQKQKEERKYKTFFFQKSFMPCWPLPSWRLPLQNPDPCWIAFNAISLSSSKMIGYAHWEINETGICKQASFSGGVSGRRSTRNLLVHGSRPQCHPGLKDLVGHLGPRTLRDGVRQSRVEQLHVDWKSQSAQQAVPSGYGHRLCNHAGT